MRGEEATERRKEKKGKDDGFLEEKFRNSHHFPFVFSFLKVPLDGRQKLMTGLKPTMKWGEVVSGLFSHEFPPTIPHGLYPFQDLFLWSGCVRSSSFVPRTPNPDHKGTNTIGREVREEIG